MIEHTKIVPTRRFKEFKNNQEWEQHKLSDLCSMHARIGWQNLRTSEFLDTGDYYLITGTDFDNGRVNLNSCHYVEKDRYEQDPKIQIDNGNILITKDGTLGKVAFVDGLDKPATLNAGVFNVKIKSENVDGKYLYQYLKAPFLMNYVSKNATGGTIKHLNQNILVDFPVILPKIEEQKLLGEFFQKLDDLITLQQHKLEKTKALKTAYLSEMFPAEGEVVPKRRFAGFTQDWEKCRLGEVSPLRGGYAFQSSKFKKNGIPILRISNILPNGTTGGEYAYYEEQDNDNNYTLSEGAALLAMSGATTGKVSILTNLKCKKVYQNQRVGYFSDLNLVDYGFISVIVRSPLFTNQVKSILVAGAQPNISSKEVNNFLFCIPTKIEEQIKIGNFFKQLDDIITHHQSKLEKLQNLKKAYLHEMFV